AADAGRQHATGETWRALGYLAIACAVLSLIALVPYVSPELRTWRAWVWGEGLPVVRLFQGEQHAVSGMEIATGGAATRGGRIEDELGAAVAQNLRDDEEEPAREPQLASEEAGPRVRIDPREL